MVGSGRMGVRPDARTVPGRHARWAETNPTTWRPTDRRSPMPTATDPRAHFRRPLDFAPSGVEAFRPAPAQPGAAPIVVAVDNSRAAAAAVQAGVSLARGSRRPAGLRLRSPRPVVRTWRAVLPAPPRCRDGIRPPRPHRCARGRRGSRRARHRRAACRETPPDASSSSPGCAPRGWSCSARVNDVCAAAWREASSVPRIDLSSWRAARRRGRVGRARYRGAGAAALIAPLSGPVDPAGLGTRQPFASAQPSR